MLMLVVVVVRGKGWESCCEVVMAVADVAVGS